MATSLSVNAIQTSIAWSFSQTNALGGNTVDTGSQTFRNSDTLTNGTGANQANKIYFAKRTLAGGANETLDLAASLLDAFGNTITFSAIKGFQINLLTETTASSILVGNTGANGWVGWCNATTDAVKIKNGYSFALFGTDAGGMTVTGGTGDLLKVTNQDGVNTATYSIVLYGI